ncbi:MAG: 16S rRNA (cytosine(1402)-N(4))-methyltransferase RsmH [Acidobacteria bacterium]|nr:MAG: 16S rRNA (cytosine(1402)-N(4))-methyltransferase RsmH [Acidobacteriota bacterium]REK03131.1 MAG: 16S rRNA (cytosine(1402)-N(4))-methyltransferase RsmH [Acidobacteriota bacterium]REK15415.1 MAG: 16S rRNA (cytosine(1402)-N(4))-methyltransferase RsmH [Acidobacteriota bacterium]REK42133.1 MAG: 16S rRNA (cytosine(1402)-N(4))-methyltransferase RsmH [Acidobacteriota bacterium]
MKPVSRLVLIDATLGLGGHSEALLGSFEDLSIVGIDRDPEAIGLAEERLARFGSRFKAVHSNFSEIESVVREMGFRSVDGIVADLGVSSLQLDSEDRGFSFRFDAPLDMRMNRDSGEKTAAELLEGLSEEEIADVIYKFGEERRSRRIARWIVNRRDEGNPVRTTTELADLVARAVGRKRNDKIHPATRTFQALRIAVNREIEVLEEFVADSIDLLSAGGRLAVITFHSLEDRVIKRSMQKASGRCFCPPKFPKCVCGMTDDVEILTRKPIVPSEEEVSENPRARSAKLRACQKKQAVKPR